MTRNPAALFTSPALSFAGFTLWLLAFAMAGPLQAGRETPDALWLFLVPHILTLILIGIFASRELTAITVSGTLLAIAATISFLLYPASATLAIVVAGVGGAALAVRVGVQLSQSQNPGLSAFQGLILANLLLVAVETLPLPMPFKYLLVIILMAVTLVSVSSGKARGEIKPLVSVLVFAFIYHLIAGFLYGYIFPLYQQSAWFDGVELIPYCLAVGMALYVFRKHQIVPLFIGVVLAMTACVFLYPMTDFGTNLGMWTMQGASGFVDLFLVAYLVTWQNPVRAFAAGCATICSGIFAGSWVSGALATNPELLIFAASVILNLAALSLFLVYRQNRTVFPAPPEKDSNGLHLSKLLSEREFMVLKMVMNGARYREVALAMSISESSVKTYMNRIFEKTHTRGKKQLLKNLQDAKGVFLD